MAETTLVWATPPSRRRPAIFVVALASAFLGWFLVHQPFVALLGPAMLLGATADHWLPTRFRLDAKGASSQTGPSVTAMSWGDVRRVLVRGSEVRLSPLENSSALDVFRGVCLLTTLQNHEQVLDFVRGHAPEAPLQ